MAHESFSVTSAAMTTNTATSAAADPRMTERGQREPDVQPNGAPVKTKRRIDVRGSGETLFSPSRGSKPILHRLAESRQLHLEFGNIADR
jgi:hypothetical protein